MRSGIDAEVGVWVAGTDQVVVDGPQIAAVVLQQVSGKIFRRIQKPAAATFESAKGPGPQLVRSCVAARCLRRDRWVFLINHSLLLFSPLSATAQLLRDLAHPHGPLCRTAVRLNMGRSQSTACSGGPPARLRLAMCPVEFPRGIGAAIDMSCVTAQPRSLERSPNAKRRNKHEGARLTAHAVRTSRTLRACLSKPSILASFPTYDLNLDLI